MEDCYSEIRGFEPLSGTLPLADIKISNQYHATCCAIARLATLSRFMYRYLSGEWKKLILYIKCVSSKMGQKYCMLKGPLEAHF